jgi:hypothetical protein
VLALILASGHTRKELTEEEPYPYWHFGYCRIGGGRVRSHDSRNREIARLEKDLWIDKLQISAGNRKEPIQLKGIENDPVSRSRSEGR